MRHRRPGKKESSRVLVQRMQIQHNNLIHRPSRSYTLATSRMDVMMKNTAVAATLRNHSSERPKSRAGKIKYALLGWLIGLPLPIIIILLFVRGCDF